MAVESVGAVDDGESVGDEVRHGIPHSDDRLLLAPRQTLRLGLNPSLAFEEFITPQIFRKSFRSVGVYN